MTKSFTLKTQLTMMMALLVLLQSLALAAVLFLSGAFLMLDAEAFRVLNSTVDVRSQSFNGRVARLVSNVTDEASAYSDQLQLLSDETGVSFGQMFEHDEAYLRAALIGSNTVIRLLQQNSITGAFVILEGSNSQKQDANAHSAIYIRNPTPGRKLDDLSSYLLEVGPTEIIHRYQISTSTRWRLDLRFDEPKDFYQRPLYAAGMFGNAEIERYGYWSAPGAILEDNQSVVCYTVPLLSPSGEAFGVLGIEISMVHFTRQYLPDTDLPYRTSFYAIAPVQDNMMSLDWYIPSGPLAQVYLQRAGHLLLKPVDGDKLFATDLGSLGAMYCSTQPLRMYSDNSPFVEENWTLAGFVPKDVMHEGSYNVRRRLILSILITTAVSFASIFLLAYASTRKISGLSRYINSLSPFQELHFKRTGMQEVDELTTALARLNKSVIHSSATISKILELTLLPIGGFEVSLERDTVVLTEYVCNLLRIEPGTILTAEQWEEWYARLTAKPCLGYEDTYRFEIPETGNTLWLRMKQAPTPTGRVGVVLDVTREFEENRRLSHKLDYDALTQLYNRTAFKREVYARIAAEPDKTGAMIFCDLDDLKYINDTFGHNVGDQFIFRAGEMFREFCILGGLVSRISGDEFAIYLHGFNNKDQLRRLIKNQIRQSEHFCLRVPNGTEHRIRFSAGIAWYPNDADNVSDLLKLSDYAMYETKHNSKGEICEFDQSCYQESPRLTPNEKQTADS